jgi:hypothetical protein
VIDKSGVLAMKFSRAQIPGLGEVCIRHLKGREVMALGEASDWERWVNRLIALCVYDGSLHSFKGASESSGVIHIPADGFRKAKLSPLFASAEEVEDLDWPQFKPLSAAALRINNLDVKSAEGNSPAPPSSR